MQRLRAAASAWRRGLSAATAEVSSFPPPWVRHAHAAAAPEVKKGRLAPKPDEGDLLLLQALPRAAAGRISAAKERKQGRIPAVVFNQFDHDKLMITLNSHDLLRRLIKFKKSGFMARVYTMELPGEAGAPPQRIPVLPKQLYVDGVSNAIEAVAFLRCPPDARVKVEVPLFVMGEDASPGLRKGGTVNTMRRKVRLFCLGNCVPPSFTLDISPLDVGQKIVLRDLKLPEGVSHVETDLGLPILKIMGRSERKTEDEVEAEAAAASAAASAPSAAGGAGGAAKAAAGGAAKPAAGGSAGAAKPAAGGAAAKPAAGAAKPAK